MLIIILYLLINFIIFVFLKKEKYAVALRVQAVSFVCLFACLLVTSDVAFISSSLSSWLGSSYTVFRNALIKTFGSAATPILVVEFAFAVLAMCILAVTVRKVATILTSQDKYEVEIKSERKYNGFYILNIVNVVKKYILYGSFIS